MLRQLDLLPHVRAVCLGSAALRDVDAELRCRLFASAALGEKVPQPIPIDEESNDAGREPDSQLL